MDMVPKSRARRVSLAAALTAVPIGLALRFAYVYRDRAGYPKRRPPTVTPADLGLDYATIEVPTADGLNLAGWFIPAADTTAVAPGIALIHGWESARDRTLPHAQVLHAAGYHVLTLDVRGHGANGPEELPLSAGEFAADARAGVRALRARPEVSKVALVGHSIGGAGALIAAAAGGDGAVDVVIALAPPAGAYRLTRLTFQLADLPIPSLVAWPLAWLTTHVYLRPRGHAIRDVDAVDAIRRIEAPVLLILGTDDHIVPPDHMARLASVRRSTRPDAVTETLLVEGGHHSWIYEFPEVRATMARFLATSLGGPLAPDVAAARAVAVDARRPPEPERLSAVDAEPGGIRSVINTFKRVQPKPEVPDARP
jgi:pimeloyl-ACP methyl ester carboxylesterase